MSPSKEQLISRREILRAVAMTAGGVLLGGCSPWLPPRSEEDITPVSLPKPEPKTLSLDSKSGAIFNEERLTRFKEKIFPLITKNVGLTNEQISQASLWVAQSEKTSLAVLIHDSNAWVVRGETRPQFKTVRVIDTKGLTSEDGLLVDSQGWTIYKIYSHPELFSSFVPVIREVEVVKTGETFGALELPPCFLEVKMPTQGIRVPYSRDDIDLADFIFRVHDKKTNEVLAEWDILEGKWQKTPKPELLYEPVKKILSKENGTFLEVSPEEARKMRGESMRVPLYVSKYILAPAEVIKKGGTIFEFDFSRSDHEGLGVTMPLGTELTFPALVDGHVRVNPNMPSRGELDNYHLELWDDTYKPNQPLIFINFPGNGKLLVKDQQKVSLGDALFRVWNNPTDPSQKQFEKGWEVREGTVAVLYIDMPIGGADPRHLGYVTLGDFLRTYDKGGHKDKYVMISTKSAKP